MNKEKKVKTALVLGSGAARGLAHIGVIKCLEESGYEIQSVAGSSMGALIGGVYASGQLDLYTNWVSALKTRDIVKLLDISFSTNSLFKGEKIIQVLKTMIGDRNIEDLPISYTAVATDINKQKEFWFTKGSLFDAIRASIAIPMIFSPVTLSNKVLVDGGIINPIPIAPTRREDTEVTIAVILNGKPEVQKKSKKESINLNQNENSYRQRIDKFIDSLKSKTKLENHTQDLGAFNLISQSMETMQASITRYKIAAYRPEIVIEIPHNVCFWYEFDRAQELIALGYKRAQEALKSNK